MTSPNMFHNFKGFIFYNNLLSGYNVYWRTFAGLLDFSVIPFVLNTLLILYCFKHRSQRTISVDELDYKKVNILSNKCDQKDRIENILQNKLLAIHVISELKFYWSNLKEICIKWRFQSKNLLIYLLVSIVSLANII